jgi:hypothetical protein
VRVGGRANERKILLTNLLDCLHGRSSAIQVEPRVSCELPGLRNKDRTRANDLEPIWPTREQKKKDQSGQAGHSWLVCALTTRPLHTPTRAERSPHFVVLPTGSSAPTALTCSLRTLQTFFVCIKRFAILRLIVLTIFAVSRASEKHSSIRTSIENFCILDRFELQ